MSRFLSPERATYFAPAVEIIFHHKGGGGSSLPTPTLFRTCDLLEHGVNFMLVSEDMERWDTNLYKPSEGLITALFLFFLLIWRYVVGSFWCSCTVVLFLKHVPLKLYTFVCIIFLFYFFSNEIPQVLNVIWGTGSNSIASILQFEL
jgi:hypothetical protein